MKCCICGKEIEGYGNNPDGAAKFAKDGTAKFLKFKTGARCCDDCNLTVVFPGRLYQIIQDKTKIKEC